MWVSVESYQAAAVDDQEADLLDDTTASQLAPHLSSLRNLALRGYTRLSREGLFEMLRETTHLNDLRIGLIGDVSRLCSGTSTDS